MANKRPNKSGFWVWWVSNADPVLALATLALVIVTGYYAWNTARTYTLMESDMEIRTRPYIHVTDTSIKYFTDDGVYDFETAYADEIRSMILTCEIKNSGVIPAEIIRMESVFTELKLNNTLTNIVSVAAGETISVTPTPMIHLIQNKTVKDFFNQVGEITYDITIFYTDYSGHTEYRSSYAGTCKPRITLRYAEQVECRLVETHNI